jgi:DNA invertase Pin-like site-specific DNA recombinase
MTNPATGAERIFGEQVSSVAKRMKLAECLAFMREGDVLTVPNRTGWRAARPDCCLDAAQIKQLRAELGPAAIAKRLGIARSSVYRALA